MLKKIIKLLILLLIIWGIIFIINIYRCLNYKTPILYLYSIGDEYVCTYKLLGYNVDISKKSNKIIQTKMNFFSITLFETDLLDITKLNRTIQNVKISVIESSINKNGIKIIIVDNNPDSYTWDDNYKIEQKIDKRWIELEPNKDVNFSEITYNRDEKNQIIFEINWNENYGELSSGIYRIGKTVFDNGENKTIYSNEFEIIN